MIHTSSPRVVVVSEVAPQEVTVVGLFSWILQNHSILMGTF